MLFFRISFMEPWPAWLLNNSYYIYIYIQLHNSRYIYTILCNNIFIESNDLRRFQCHVSFSNRCISLSIVKQKVFTRFQRPLAQAMASALHTSMQRRNHRATKARAHPHRSYHVLYNESTAASRNIAPILVVVVGYTQAFCKA